MAAYLLLRCRMGGSQREAILSAADEEEVLLLVVFCEFCELVKDGASDQGIEAALRVETKVRQRLLGW